MKKVYSIIALLSFVFVMTGQIIVSEDWESSEVGQAVTSNKDTIYNGWLFRVNGAMREDNGTAVVIGTELCTGVAEVINGVDSDSLPSKMVSISYDSVNVAATNMGMMIALTLDTAYGLEITADVKLETAVKRGASIDGIDDFPSKFLKILIGKETFNGFESAGASQIKLKGADHGVFREVSRTFTAEEVKGLVTDLGEGNNDVSLIFACGLANTNGVYPSAAYRYDIDLHIDNIVVSQVESATGISSDAYVSELTLVTKPGAIEVINTLGQEGVISIYAITGRKVKEVALQSVGNTISLESGMYIVATTIEGRVSTQKVVL